MIEAYRKKLRGPYFILNIGQNCFREVPRWLEGVIANGARIIQVRGKDVHPMKLKCVVEEIMLLARRYDALVIVNDFPDLAHDVHAHGVHLGREDPSVKDVRAKYRDLIIGATVRNLKQATAAVKAGADYIAVGSIFPSPTKREAPLVGLDAIIEIKQNLPDVPLCAIGGITNENITDVIHAGADMAAVVSAITCSSNPEKTALGFAIPFGEKQSQPLPDEDDYDWDEISELGDEGLDDGPDDETED